MRALIKRVNAGLRITKVVATRSVKGSRGDSFAGFSAAWNSTQEDGGNGVETVMDEGDEAQSLTGMTLQEAIVASILVAREADLAAYRNAAAGGNISGSLRDAAAAAIKANYSKMMAEALGDPDVNTNDGK